MRPILILSLFAANLAGAAWGDYEETRDLKVDTGGIDTLRVDAGAGYLQIVGVEGLDDIEVTATIVIDGEDDDDALHIIESDMRLSLEKDGDTATLVAMFDNSGWRFGDSPLINLDVRVPSNLHLLVDDGSGSIDISKVRGDISLDDGSGSLRMTDVGGNIEIDDGSGSIDVTGVGGDIRINDGSGSIDVRNVTGSVTVDDGSGGIDVRDVGKDLIIVDDGSGGLDYSNISGRVEDDS